MKKEVLLAIAIGFTLGLVITFGIWTANKSLKNAAAPQATPAPTGSPLPTTAETLSPTPPSSSAISLTITSPEDESLLNKDSVTISGKSAPLAMISIISESREQIVTADASGNFTADIDLEGGYNIISITAFDASGNSASQTITLSYTTAKV
ncbi:hypothetical protein A2876_03965 [Candidatus Amesbacteria bacterium RIFCSPHIGHO2_01_FULL_48_32b]|uniref:Bacterial Ig domain-containing protein n=1 Tax=Candidatus Amesbacteria bacterium RIFCSPHIGHO2_01_FULL_48_32b TaxID=1797253 RepID=A0A1F4YD36_9BACT|nr:MAG: hypothetical protein A2876_03965 [Candidatus Amesbacteria bacterium RIFCSPHIGHO2_01_FULL_48_32b]